jgi:hypothetical protein
MSLRCPYCRRAFEVDGDVHRCPHCGRTALARGYFRRPGEAGAAPQQPWSPAQGRRLRAPGLPIAGRPFVTLLVLAALLAIGSLLVRRATRYNLPPDEPYYREVAQRNVDALRLAVDQFARDCGQPPPAEPGLEALVHDPGLKGWRGPYVFQLKPDPWDRPFLYELSNGVYRLLALGPDGVPDTADDVLPSPVAATNAGPDDLIPVSIPPANDAAR